MIALWLLLIATIVIVVAQVLRDPMTRSDDLGVASAISAVIGVGLLMAGLLNLIDERIALVGLFVLYLSWKLAALQINRERP